jgi:hypothetical protein
MTVIKNYRGETLFESEGDLKDTIEEAVRAKVSLVRTSWRDANLQGVTLRKAFMPEADFSGADLRYANLKGDFTGSHFVGAILHNADLRGSCLVYANFNDSDLSGADLSGAGLTYATLVNANLEGVNLTNTRMQGVLISPYSLENPVLIRLPNLISIDGQEMTVDAWDKVLMERSYDPLTLANYEACKAFLRASAPLEPSKAVSRFERI